MNSKLKGLTFFCLIAMILMCPVMMPCAYASSNEVASQQDIYKTVYLKNGTEIKGTVTEEDGMIKVVSVSGDVFYFSKEEVREIDDPTKAVMRQRMRDSLQLVKEQQLAFKQQKKDSLQSVRMQKREFRRENRLSGYFLSLDFGSTLTPSSALYSKMASAAIINGYRLCNWFQAGVGLEYAYYNYRPSFDIYLHLKSPFLGRKKVSPYISEDLGYRADLGGIFSGILSTTSLGVQFNINDRNAISLGVVYSLTAYGIDAWHSLGLKLAYTFYGNKKK